MLERRYEKFWSKGIRESPNYTMKTYQLQLEKTYLLTRSPIADSDQTAHPRSLIRVYFDRMKKCCILGYPKCSQWRFGSACANAQADLNLRWGHMSDTFSDVCGSYDAKRRKRALMQFANRECPCQSAHAPSNQDLLCFWMYITYITVTNQSVTCNNGPDQFVGMRKLIWALMARLWQNGYFCVLHPTVVYFVNGHWHKAFRHWHNPVFSGMQIHGNLETYVSCCFFCLFSCPVWTALRHTG